VFGTVGVLEMVVMRDAKGTGESPGDFLNGISWNASAEEKREKKSVELNNGRAAQMGILGLIAHEQINNEPYILNAFLGYPTHFNEGLI
jgi:Chlorophyll A-B binding protein